MKSADPEDDAVWPFEVIDLSGHFPDNDRILEAIGDAVAYEKAMDKDWWDEHTYQQLWQNVSDIWAEEYKRPKEPFPHGANRAMMNYYAAVAEAQEEDWKLSQQFQHEPYA